MDRVDGVDKVDGVSGMGKRNNRIYSAWAAPAALSLFMLAAVSALAAETPVVGLVYSAANHAALLGGTDRQDLYRAAITENGGAVAVIAQTVTEAELAAVLDTLDAVLLPGGIDVDPKFYGEARHEELEKTDAELDALEFRLLDHAAARGLPVLGICRGHQVMNVHFGGSLLQDIPAHFDEKPPVGHRYPDREKEKRRHPVQIAEGTLLRELLGLPEMTVNTYHHQAVNRLAAGFVVSARTGDGLVEAMERPGGPFMVGVQFHPEKMRKDNPQINRLFERFVQEARGARARRLQGAAE